MCVSGGCWGVEVPVCRLLVEWYRCWWGIPGGGGGVSAVGGGNRQWRGGLLVRLRGYW